MLRKSGWGSLLAILLACSCDHSVSSIPETADEPDQRWFVELAAPPLRAGGDAATLKAGVTRFHDVAAAKRIRYQERLVFERLWNGLSVDASPSDARRMLEVDGVTAIYPVELIEMPPMVPAEVPDDDSSLTLIGADIVQSELGFTGEGVRVAVIDSGIDWHHPDLGGCFGPGCRVAYGWDFVGDYFNAGIGTQPVPDDDPDDCSGHGTHVAGIIGAGGLVTGVAPDITFGAYRVFGCGGSTTADIMLAAMERADADGMRVINMSIGSTFQWPTYPTAAATQRLTDNGIVVVASAGNSGPAGLYATGAPGSGAATIGVASLDNLQATQIAFRVLPDDFLLGYTRASGAPLAPLMGEGGALVRTGTSSSEADACEPLEADSLTGAIALIRRGGCTFHIKALHAQLAGAAGVVLYNNAPGALTPTVSGDPPVTIPVVSLSQVDGDALDALLAESEASLEWTADVIATPVATAGQISGFSSWGPTADLSLKPDVTAPGGAIWSTYPLESGGYVSLNGTSMSSPHVAGAAALILEARPATSPEQVADLLRNTAEPVANAGADALEPTIRQGAGVIQVDRAILATGVITPSKLSLGENETGAPTVRTLALTNVGDTAATWELSHTTAATVTGGVSWTPVLDASVAAAASFSQGSVTVGPGETATIEVTLTPDGAMAPGSYYTGWIVATRQGSTDTLRVPYLGYRGDYQDIPVLAPTEQGYPWIARQIGGSYVQQPEDTEYSLVGSDRPWVVFHLNHFAARLRILVQDDAGKPWGLLAEYSNVAHGSGPTAAVGVQWDGNVTIAKDRVLVPNGTYRLRIEALRALGDESNSSHWETWTSPLVIINHP